MSYGTADSAPETPGSDVPGSRMSTAERAQRVRFRRAITLMLMTLAVPGSAQLVAGNKRVGRIAMRIWMGLIVAAVIVGVVSLFTMRFPLWLGTNIGLLSVARLFLIVLALGWAALIVDAWRLGQPLSLRQNHRLAVVGLNGVLCFSVAGMLLFGAHVVGVQRDLMQTMFGNGEVKGAHAGRFNVLLIGGDAGAGRWGLRTDSMTVASIDAETGRTVLISLPRNMQNFPFSKGSLMAKQFPDGFDEPDLYLNSLSTWAADHKDVFKGVENPGVEATVQAAEGITGLSINYWAMVNLEGFKSLVDAVGGITLNVRQPIPVGLPHEKTFHYIKAGNRELTGFETLWFARAREGSDDYSRMARQKCVMSAMLDQVSPQVMLTNFQEIAQAGSELISTSVPASEVGKFVELALKAKDQKISSVSLVPPMINTADPDIDVVHRAVADAIARAEGRKPAPKPTPSETAQAAAEGGASEASAEATTETAPPATTPAAPESVTGGSVGSMKDGYAANQSEDVAAVC